MLGLTHIKENEQKAGTHKVFLRSPLRCKKKRKKKGKTILGQILKGTTTSRSKYTDVQTELCIEIKL